MANAGQTEECDHPRSQVRRKTDKLGRPYFVRQCLDCGCAASMAIQRSKAVVECKGEPEPFDDDLYERGRQKISAAYAEGRAEYEAGREDRQAEYNEYLQSNQWQAIRRLVLKRAGFMCEGCGIAAATDVHHTTYDHRGAEFLFELVALCRECHKRISGL